MPADVHDRRRIYLSLVRAAEDTGHVAADRKIRAQRGLGDRGDTLQGGLDTDVDIALIERLRGGGEDGDLLCAGGEGAVQALAVGHQYRIVGAGAPIDALNDLLVTSMAGRPVALSRSTSSILTPEAIAWRSFCKPSRGPTSTTRTCRGIALTTGRSRQARCL